MMNKSKLRFVGGVVLLFNLWLIGRYNLEGIPVLLLTFGFAFGYEYLIVRPTSKAAKGIEDKQKKCPSCAEKIKFEAIKCRYCGHEFDPLLVEEEVKEHTKAVFKSKTANAPSIQERVIPHNSYVCGGCDFVVEKDKFEDSNLFCPTCGSILEET